MNTLMKVILIVLILIFGMTDLAKAGDSYQISISCVIPEIPGVNTPSIQENQIRANYEMPPAQQNAQNSQEEDSTKAPETIQTEKEVQLAENKKEDTVILKTIYSR